MKRILICAVLLCMSGIAHDFVSNIPNGSFTGTGTWTDNQGAVQPYETSVVFNENVMRVDYSWAENSTTLVFDFKFVEPGIFELTLSGGSPVGQGSCQDEECHYVIDVGDLHVAESIAFKQDDQGKPYLVKTGHKQIGDWIIRWEEILHSVDM